MRWGTYLGARILETQHISDTLPNVQTNCSNIGICSQRILNPALCSCRQVSRRRIKAAINRRFGWSQWDVLGATEDADTLTAAVVTPASAGGTLADSRVGAHHWQELIREAVRLMQVWRHWCFMSRVSRWWATALWMYQGFLCRFRSMWISEWYDSVLLAVQLHWCLPAQLAPCRNVSNKGSV